MVDEGLSARKSHQEPGESFGRSRVRLHAVQFPKLYPFPVLPGRTHIQDIPFESVCLFESGIIFPVKCRNPPAFCRRALQGGERSNRNEPWDGFNLTFTG